MSQQIRAAALLRQAAQLLSINEEITEATETTGPIVPSMPTTGPISVTAAARYLFGPYNSRRMGPCRGRRQARTVTEPISRWSHRFCVVSRCSQVGHCQKNKLAFPTYK